MPTQQELVTTKEAAERLGVHITTMRRWCREDKIPNKKIGGVLFIPEEALRVDMSKWQRKQAA